MRHQKTCVGKFRNDTFDKNKFQFHLTSSTNIFQNIWGHKGVFSYSHLISPLQGLVWDAHKSCHPKIKNTHKKFKKHHQNFFGWSQVPFKTFVIGYLQNIAYFLKKLIFKSLHSIFSPFCSEIHPFDVGKILPKMKFFVKFQIALEIDLKWFETSENVR